VAIYVRISDDHRTGRAEGVATQERWGRAYAAQHWPGIPVVVYRDNDLSASDPTVVRPGFEALRGAIRAGDVAHLWTVEQSRLERTAGWFAFAAELDAAGVEDVHTKRDGIVRVLDDVAGIKAVLAAGESRRTRQRIRDRVDVLASEGRPSGGRTYGYVPGVDEQGRKTLLVVPEEATIIRQTADRIISGWSLTRIAADLEDRGVRGVLRRPIRDADGIVIGRAEPVQMTTPTIRSIVTNLTVVGKRIHRGQTVNGIWEPILAEDVWNAVRDELSAPRVVTTAKGQKALVGTQRQRRKHLLSGGPVVCGRCGVALVGSVRRYDNGQPKIMYWCSPQREDGEGNKGCGRLGIMAAPLEEYILETLFTAIESKAPFLEALHEDPYRERREAIGLALRSVEADRRALAAEWSAGGTMTMDEWKIARDGLASREQNLRAELAGLPRPARPHDLDEMGGIREAWPYMTLDEQRAIVVDFVDQVRVLPAQRGGRHDRSVAERVTPPETWWRRSASSQP